MQTYRSLFERELAAIAERRIESLRDNLEVQTPAAQTDYIRGQIAALRELPDLMAEATEKSDQANR